MCPLVPELSRVGSRDRRERRLHLVVSHFVESDAFWGCLDQGNCPGLRGRIEGPGVARAGERSLRIQVVGGDGVFYSAPLPPPLPTRQAELLLSLSRVSDILQALRSIGPVTYGRATGTITWDERHMSKLPVQL